MTSMTLNCRNKKVFYVLILITGFTILLMFIFTNSPGQVKLSSAERIRRKDITTVLVANSSSKFRLKIIDDSVNINGSITPTSGSKKGTDFEYTLEDFVPNVSDIKNYFLKELSSKKIIFNRIVKCGSKATRLAFQITAQKKQAICQNKNYLGTFYKPAKQLEEIAEYITNQKEPYIYVRHIHFIDFSKFGFQTPSYINIVRDPFNRLVSWFYFKKYIPPGGKKMFDSFLHTNQTFDECVQSNNPVCMAETEYFQIIPWFCGHDLDCRLPSVNALNKAKRNVVNYYPVVGYIEDADGFFRVAEKIWPQFFTGLPEVGKKMLALASHETSNKITPTNRTRDIMMEKLGLEYDFYKFIKQRFNVLSSYILNEL